MKLVFVALLAVSVLSANLTPNSKMPPAFDDMLFNNLGAAAPTGEVASGVHKISRVIPDGMFTQLIDFVKIEAAWINDKSLKALLTSAKSMTQFDIQTHFILIAKQGQTFSNAAMIHLVYTEGGMKAVLSQDTFEGYQTTSDDLHYHEFKLSLMGLPFSKQITLIGVKSIYQELIQKKLLKAVQLVRGTQKGDLLAAELLGQTSFTGVLDAINQVAKAWKAIADAFKTVNKETLKYVIKGQGFSQYASKSRFLRSIGINLAGWETYKRNYLIITGLDESPQAKYEAEGFLGLAEFMPDNAWYFNTASFDIKRNGDTTSVVSMSKADLEFNKAHVLTVTASGTFTLAPDVYVYEKFRSVAGGIYQNTKDVRKNVPRSLTPEDVKALHALTILNAINVMTGVFNIPFNLPESPLNL